MIILNKKFIFLLSILVLIVTIILNVNIFCDSYYWSQGQSVLWAIERGDTVLYIGDDIAVEHGNITEKGREVVLGSGFSEQDIINAQNSYNSSHSNSTNDNTVENANSSEKNTADQQQETSNNKTEIKDKSARPNYTEQEIEAAWTEMEKIEPTCTETGYATYSNTLTGETKSEELPLADHKYVETERKEATCTEAGSITYTCEICGDTYSEEIPALSHDYEWVTTKEASFFTLGEKQYVCKNCGDVSKTREISATCPSPLMGIIIGICVVIIGAVSGIVVLKKKRTIKEI